MQEGKFNVITGGNYGSEGKGWLSSVLISRYRPEVLSTTNFPNAGHTAVNVDGERFIAKAIPAGSIMSKWLVGYCPKVLVGPSAAFSLDTLMKETEEAQAVVKIHPRASIVTAAHKARESEAGSGCTKSIASTMQGSSAAMIDKILRQNPVLARDCDALRSMLLNDMEWHLHRMLQASNTALHEGSQGFSLDINHGHSYPFCTSRQTTAMQNCADMGIPPKLIGDVYVILRPYPIRVGNVIEDGVQKGFSGGCYEDQKEITWQQVAAEAGMPEEEAQALLQKELTTVTKRLRRVFTFSENQVREACAINGATKIALNFANYVDWSCYQQTDWSKLPKKVLAIVDTIETETNVKVAMVGTGPRRCDVCWQE